MAQYVGVRALSRSTAIRVVNSAGAQVKLTPTADTVIDLDLATNRRALANHSAIGQFIVTAANDQVNGNVALPTDT
jgi:predicted polyphosphate/ATP-dependent NAD kinase